MKEHRTSNIEHPTSNKVGKAAPAWHAQVAAEIKREFAETNDLNEKARHRRARLGLMLIWVKEAGKADGSIPHGHFGDWLELNAPGIPRRTVGDYLTEAKSICDLLRWQNGEIRHFETPPHKLLSADSADLKGVERERKKKLSAIIEQQAAVRAVTRYAQCKLVDDAMVPAKGRLKGSDGNPKAKREAHARKLHEADIAGRKVMIAEFGETCDEMASEGLLADPELRDEFERAWPKVENMFRAWQRVSKAFKG